MLLLLGYFLVAVSADVAASGIIGYILVSMLIRRYERAERPIKSPRQEQLQFGPSLIHPLHRQLQPMCLGFLHCLENLSFDSCNLDERAGPTAPVNRSKRVAAFHIRWTRFAADFIALV